MEWGRQQEQALDRVGDWLRSGDQQVHHLFGFAGTGKTTLAKHIAEQEGGTTLFGAYTGKASLVLRQKGCVGASTIHSMIYRSREKSNAHIAKLRDSILALGQELAMMQMTEEEIENNTHMIELRRAYKAEGDESDQPLFKLNHESVVKDADLIIIDECSMVDAQMGADLMSFGTPILVLGDPAQLPPVFGEGYFTKDVKPDSMLTEIHRQAADNPIIRMSILVRNEEPLPVGDYGENCHVYPTGYKMDEETTLSFDQMLVGRNATRFLVNRKLRKLRGITDPLPVAGDKLVCLKNNSDEGILNGQLFEVAHVDGIMDQKVQMSVRSDDSDSVVDISAHEHFFLGTQDKLGFFEKKEAEHFDYGYGLTVHKSQGSQWNKVCLLNESFCFKQQRHKWLYTGITRAAEEVSVINM